MKENFATAAPVKNVPGIGEAAFLVPDDRFHRFVVLQGNLLIDVLNPGNPADQKKIVQLVLAH